MARTTTRRGPITRLEEHPNEAEICAVLAQLPHLEDDHVRRLAAAWTNDGHLSLARDKALRPDSPLVLETLCAFDALGALFGDDLDPDATWVTVDPETTRRALKAIRDAVAAAYARPVLSRSEHAALTRPWRTVFPGARTGRAEADLGPHGAAVRALLAVLPDLAARCHDPHAARGWDALVAQSLTAGSAYREARAAAFDVAVLTSRRRLWHLVRRSGTEGLTRGCPTCRTRFDAGDRDHQRVLELCLDAACALLVADALSDEHTETLVAPVRHIVPGQRRA